MGDNNNINDWKDVPINDWQDVPLQQPTRRPKAQSFLQSRFPEVYDPLIDLKYNAPKMYQRGSIVGGSANAGNAELNLVLSPIGIAQRKIRELINHPSVSQNPVLSNASDISNVALDALGLIPQAGGYALRKATEAGLGYAGELFGHNLGTTPENAGDIYREVPKLAETVGSVAGIEPIVKGISAVKKTVPPILEERNINAINKEVKFVAPPKAKELNYDQNQAVWNKYIKEQYKKNPIDRSSPENAVRQTTDLTQDAMNELWDNKIAPINNSFGDSKIINGKSVAESVIADATANKYAVDFKPEQVQKLVDNAKILDKQMSPQETVEYIKGMNADLTNYYKKTDTERANIDNKFGGIAGLKLIRDALAKEYFDKMESFGVKDMRQARLDYGALSSMHDAFERNITRSEKPTPPITFRGLRTSLPSGAAVVGGLMTQYAVHDPITSAASATGAYMLTNYLKNRATPNATIIRALERIAKSNIDAPTTPSFNPNIKGFIGKGAIQTPPPADATGFTQGEPYTHYNVSQKQKLIGRGAIVQPIGNPARVETPNGTELHYFDENGNLSYSITLNK